MSFRRLIVSASFIVVLTHVTAAVCVAQNLAVGQRLKPHGGASAGVSGAPAAVSPGNWSQRAKLVAPNFYASFISPGGAISGDTAVISEGAIKGFKNAVADVFVKTAQGWQNAAPVATLTGPEPEEPFTAPVAIDGDTIVVAGPVGFDGIAGYVFVYVKPAGGWKDMLPTAVLTPSDTNDTDFGDSVSISGDTIVVGDNGYGGNIYGLGSAYVYVKPKGGWHNMTETGKLTASDGVNTDLFGWSVSISGGTIVMELRPIRDPFGAVLESPFPADAEKRYERFLGALGRFAPGAVDNAKVMEGLHKRLAAPPAASENRSHAFLWLWVTLRPLCPDEPSECRALSWIDEWMLADIMRGALVRSGWLDRAAVPGPGLLGFLVRTGEPVADIHSWPELLADPAAQRFLEVNEFEGVRWFSKESLELFAACLAEIAPCEGWKIPGLQTALNAAETASYRWNDFLDLLRPKDVDPGAEHPK